MYVRTLGNDVQVALRQEDKAISLCHLSSVRATTPTSLVLKDVFGSGYFTIRNWLCVLRLT